MTFSSQVKNEIVRSRIKNDKCRKIEFYGTLFVSGCFYVAKESGILLKTENDQVASHIYALIKSQFNFDAVLEEKKQEHRKSLLYVIRISGQNLFPFLEDIHFLDRNESGMSFASELPPFDVNDEEQVKAFIRGCFLGTGSCTDPSEYYSAEILCPNKKLADGIADLLRFHDISAKVTERRQKFVVYIREGDSVTGFLAFIGSHVSALGLENVRAEKETRNYVNRATNCENANIDKTVSAAINQNTAIENIISHGYYAHLSNALRQAADLRLEYPDATLQELADLANIKKSGMNHRLYRLIELSERLEKGLL